MKKPTTLPLQETKNYKSGNQQRVLTYVEILSSAKILKYQTLHWLQLFHNLLSKPEIIEEIGGF